MLCLCSIYVLIFSGFSVEESMVSIDKKKKMILCPNQFKL